MSAQVTRRGFLAGSAITAGLLGLAGCSTGTGASKLPSADKYPIDPDSDSVKAKWTSEETRDGWTRVTNPDGGAELGIMDASKIIQVDGLAFKDLNGNGKLDFYEDWRQSVDDRAKSLADSMSAEDCIKLMWNGGADSASAASTPGAKTDATDVSGVTAGSRAGVSRLSANADNYANAVKWINDVQAEAEKSLYGIPYLNSTDPYTTLGIPSSVTLAAAMDPDVWRKAGMWTGRAWRATGVTMELGPQIDVYSQPMGTRFSGSVSEDPALNRDFCKAYSGGLQSTWGDDEATDDQGWGKDSVASMLKHFVGEGCPEGGRNDHTDMGKWNVFPGSNFNAHLIPFLDGGMHLDSKTGEAAAMMPCYGIAYDPNDPDALGEHVGSAFSKHNISILRNAGFDGMLATDWMVLSATGHGVKNLDEAHRYLKLLESGVDQHGGSFEPEVGNEAYGLYKDETSEDEALARVRDSARRIIKLMMNVQLFEEPYADRTAAKAVFENENGIAFGKEAAEKCVVMLKNAGNTISSKGISGKVYVPQAFTAASKSFFGSTPASIASMLGDTDISSWDVVTDKVADPSGTDDSGNAVPQESDITRLTAEELADVSYAVVKIKNPTDPNQGVIGGAAFMGGTTGEATPAEYYPMTLQYHTYTADGPNVRKQSLNGEDEYGVTENRSYYGKSSTASNESDLNLIADIKGKLPATAKLICIVVADRPMIFSELEPYCDVILFEFAGSVMGSAAAKLAPFVSIINGKVEPSGLLSAQLPKDMDTVEASYEDVPRDLECYTDSEGNTYDFCFGLNWSGVINDDRVQTYKVDPLTQPETEVTVSE